jgi:hypothetical protein
MNTYDHELLPATAASITDVSHAVVLVLCVGFMLMPLAILVSLLYGGIRRRRLSSDNESLSLQDGNRRATARPSPRGGRP